MQHCKGLVFLWTDFDKRIRRSIPKSCFPSDCAGKCVGLQIEVCSEVLCCYSVSHRDCHPEHTILMLTVTWHCTPVLLLHLQTEKDKVVLLFLSSTALIIHPFSSTGHVYCCIIYCICVFVFFPQCRWNTVFCRQLKVTKWLNIIKGWWKQRLLSVYSLYLLELNAICNASIKMTGLPQDLATLSCSSFVWNTLFSSILGWLTLWACDSFLWRARWWCGKRWWICMLL